MSDPYGNTDTVAATFTRPNDTTAYAIGDVVGPTPGALLTFNGAARLAGGIRGGSGYITKVRVVKSGAVVTNATFQLFLYSDPPTPVDDNAPWPLLWANRAKRIGIVPDLAMTTGPAGSDSASAQDIGLRLGFGLPDGADDLYGVLVAQAAYGPAANEQFYVELVVERN